MRASKRKGMEIFKRNKSLCTSKVRPSHDQGKHNFCVWVNVVTGKIINSKNGKGRKT